MNLKIFPAGFLILIFTIFTFAQTQTDGKAQTDSTDVLESVSLRFDLEGVPNPQAAGFDKLKGKWKLQYELRLSDEKTLSALNQDAYKNCRQNTSGYQKCVEKANRKLRKIYKKNALFITKNTFQKSPLSSEADRTVNFPVNFAPDVISIFNKALESKDNPTFILTIKGKVFSKTPDGKKIKYRPSVTFQYPLKQIKKDGSFNFHNVTVMGATVRISYENNKLFYGIFRN